MRNTLFIASLIVLGACSSSEKAAETDTNVAPTTVSDSASKAEIDSIKAGETITVTAPATEDVK